MLEICCKYLSNLPAAAGIAKHENLVSLLITLSLCCAANASAHFDTVFFLSSSKVNI